MVFGSWFALSSEKVCSFDGCAKTSQAKGLCSGHYYWYRKGIPLKPLRSRASKSLQSCGFEGCDKTQMVNGLCVGHNCQMKKGRELTPLKHKTSKFDIADECSGIGCDEIPKAKGLCSRHYTIQRNYGLTPDEYQVLLDRQGGRCPICRSKEPGGKGIWHIDHDHNCCPDRGKSCGKCIRNLLCNNCNTGLGLFEDNATFLMSAIQYLESHGKVSTDPNP